MFFKSKLFSFLVAFSIAVVMVSYVHSSVLKLSTNAQNVNVHTSKLIDGVPIKVTDSSNSKYVSNLPEKVTVLLRGPRNILAQLNDQNITVETEDLARFSTETVSLILSVVGLPTGVTGQVENSIHAVSIEDLVTKTVAVKPIVPEAMIAPGYTIGTVLVEPSHVVLSGKKEDIDKVDSVSATVATGATQRFNSFTQNNIAVVVKDSKNNLLDVQVNKSVSVAVTISKEIVTVPIVISLIGQNSGYEYAVSKQSVVTTQIATQTASQGQEATVVNAIVDVSKLTQSTEVEVPLLVREGVSLMQEKTVKVSILVTPKKQ